MVLIFFEKRGPMKTISKNKLLELAILSIALLTAGNSAISGILVFMQKDLALSRESAEFLITLSSIATIIAIALSESITRLIGMKKCVQIGIGLVFISGLIPVLYTTYWTIFISRIVLGFGVGLFNGHTANYISALFTGEKRASLHGMRNSMEFIGQILLLVLAGLLIKIRWNLAFLAYLIALPIFFFFQAYVRDVKEDQASGRFFLNKQVIFYVFFAGIMIMNLTALTIRFPTIATKARGMNVNINAYMTLIPIFGMTSGFAFGPINKKLKSKTILMALLVYIISNLIIGLWGMNMLVYMIGMILNVFALSMSTPYLFAEASRFARGSQNRIINNLIFIGCNIGGFLSPFFINSIARLWKSESLTQAFTSFCLIYAGLFALYFYEYLKVRAGRWTKQ